MKYTIFVRRWWKDATEPGWPDNLEPDPCAKKKTIGYADSIEEARRMCEEWNNSHDEGRYSRKAEFQS